ncbi:MAG: potassium transporter Kup [Elusimicrobiota bacterium]
MESTSKDEPPGPGIVRQREKTSPSSRLPFLCLAALGIVYGDIGTSPLYAIRECFHGPHSVAVSPANVLGVLSLIFWSLVIVVSIKYLGYVLRADNRGEGGILALMTLVRVHNGWPRKAVLGLGLFGAALLYGDGMLTPAISVLSAVEGLEVATPVFAPYIVPATVAMLTLLFFFQKRGTSGVGAVFGPVMIIWFACLGMLGLGGIVREPGVLAAVDPAYAVGFFHANGMAGYLVLGAVFLVVTGSEALYADLGHFTRRPILITWFCVAGPGLLLNYFGQGALLLRNPAAAHNPFYRLAPQWALFPLVCLSTIAAVIASQAVITGVFSLTRQAVQLGYAPRMAIIHTSAHERGQIYMPVANWLLLACTLMLVLAFRRSSDLAAAYGIAVSLTMIITTLLAHIAARQRWRWRLPAALMVTAAFLFIDVAFFGANMAKVGQGGWVPLVIAIGVTLVFTTWKKGQDALRKKQMKGALPIGMFIKDVESSSTVTRVPGQAIFLCSDPDVTPSALLHNIKHNKVLHRINFLVTVSAEETPRVPESERLFVEDLGAGFTKLVVRYGFMQTPDLLAALYRANEDGIGVEPLTASYIISANTIVRGIYPGMAAWRTNVFRFLYRNALRPTLFFRLPANRVIEIGRQMQL